jgi:chemotaxis protein CheD
MVQLETEVPDVFVQPGESYLALKPTIIHTILGSCVSATLWCARLRLGALSHSQLPVCPQQAVDMNFEDGGRYVDFAIRHLARQFDELGARRTEVEVKLFGGGDVLPGNDIPPAKATIGRQNCEAAIEVVRQEGLNVTASSLGGTSGLNIRFDTRTGEVLLRRLNSIATDARLADEK